MLSREIHLIKAAQAKPFVETASRLGVPVRALACKAELPLDSVLAGHGVIGERSLWRFVELASRRPRCAQLGYLTALDHPVTRAGQLGGMSIAMARTLREMLWIFCREVVSESDGCEYRLVKRRNGTWFTRELVFKDSAAGWQAEQYVLTFITQIVRLGAPPDWLPRRIRIASRSSPASLPPEWSRIRVDWGWRRTELLIDDDVLALPPRLRTDRSLPESDSGVAERRQMTIQDLVDRQIWSRRPGLDEAARELGMSARTLKRRLAESGTSYSEILQERRLHHAKQLLETSSMPVGRIAEAVGYSAVSNFSRAFRKATGVAPATWRRR